ncbi:dioxygenase [Streptomyces sp. NPDC096311]|uniref:dioxygenase family protein n=1 Tax=Streptomyces sp. NPDC096311 TaxID=3366083 RepID=UPI0037F1B496
MQPEMPGEPLPTVFAAQGAPPLVDHPYWSAQLAEWGRALPRPKAILVISAHWERTPLAYGATSTPVPLYYDFGGLPQKYFELSYPVPGAPALAKRIEELVKGSGPLAAEPTRGLDHGAFIPLLLMYPAADIPVLQLSMPGLDPRTLLELGRSLAPLRSEGVLVFSTGLLTHSFATVDPSNPDAPPHPALAEFDAWLADTLERRDVDALLDYRTRAPGARIAVPSAEHFVPLFVGLGSALDTLPSVTFPHEGFWYGNSMRSVQFG